MKKMMMAVVMCVVAGNMFIWPETRSDDLLRTLGIAENYLVREDCIKDMVRPVRQITDHRNYFSFPGGATKVLFKSVVKKEHVFFLFLNESRNGYSEWGPGHYFIKRSRVNGKFVSIFVPYRENEGCYLEMLPADGRTMLNVYLFDKKIHQGIMLPASLETLVSAPLASVIDMTLGEIDWPTLLFRGGRPEDKLVADHVAAIRRELPRVKEAPDGAIDAQGVFVAISNGARLGNRRGLNCSGFAKWLVDGLYLPLTGRLIDIERLKERPTDRRGTRWSERDENLYDPYFGLDWTRNLATVLAGAQNQGVEPDHEAADVREVPFLRYREDAGYQVADLETILFHLAVAQPGTIFLGTVNDINRTTPHRVEYFHVAAFFPYFDDTGRFQAVVMDQHKNPSLHDFMGAYARREIHLVRINLGGDFSLLHIE
jgi:hypothetical protein